MNKNIFILTVIIVGIVIIGIAAVTMSGRNSVPPDNQENDTGEFIFGNAPVEDIEIMILESFPVQVNLNVKGYLPDSCTDIHTITKEKDGNTFFVNITTIRPADAICAQVIVPFEEKISLDVYGLKAGIYNVSVNNIKGTFILEMDNILSE